MKEVTYRGGILRFRVPGDWVEEPADAGAAYYADVPGSGTLRLTVTTMRPPNPVRPEHVVQAVSSDAQPGDPSPEILERYKAMREFWREGVEDGQPVKVKYWLVVGAAPPTTVRLALFSFTVPAGYDPVPALEVLDKEMRNVKFTELTVEDVQAVKAAGHRPS